MGKRQEGAVETRKKLLEAARSLLNEKKAENINIEDITSRAGVAKGTFYVYFKRKEDIVCEIAYEGYAAAKLTAKTAGTSAVEKIRIYLTKSAEIIEDCSLRMAQQWMKGVVAPLSGENTGVLKYSFDRQSLKELLISAIECGELSEEADVERVLDEIICEYYGAVAVWCITSGEKGLCAMIKDYCAGALSSVLSQY